MKYVYIVVVLAILGGGYYFVNAMLKENALQEAVVVQDGTHVMPDGSVMRNDVGTEGMGAMEEFRNSELQREQGAEIEAEAGVSINLDTNAEVFDVRGVNFGYDVKEIRVKKGQTVTIQFESTDGFHDLVIDEFNAATEMVQPGKPTSVTFVADESGTFEYYCSVGSHRAMGMVGKLIVE